MTNIVIGTAGHIDHGKTALVRALTGIDTDRLKEEKLRGISIDLGFAHLSLSGESQEIRIAFVDVPGHEKFIKNMLAGATGIDAVVLVIAADDGVKPQTREHLQICQLLGIQRGIVVLSKADLVESEWLELVRMEVSELLEDTFLADAPVIAVSSVSGLGLDLVRDELKVLARATANRDTEKTFRVSVDRSFSAPGWGTVLTGTVIAGSLETGLPVQLFPGEEVLRVRGLQVHGQTVSRVTAGQRAALNVVGVEASSIRRGYHVTEPGQLRPSGRFDAAVKLLPGTRELRSGDKLQVFAGAAETTGVISVLGDIRLLNAGESAKVRLRLRQPLLLLAGDRFILRTMSPPATVGGGEVLDPFPPRGWKRKDAESRLQILASSNLPEKIGLFVREAPAGVPPEAIAERTGWKATALVSHLPSSIAALEGQGAWWMHKDRVAELQRCLRSELADFHRQNPLKAGMPKEELRARVFAEGPLWVFDRLITLEQSVRIREDVLHLNTHKVALRDDETAALVAMEGAFERAGLTTPSLAEVIRDSGVDSVRARTLLQILIRQGKVVKVKEDAYFHQVALAQARDMLAAKRGLRFSVGDFKDWTGVSRKYAIPLLEHFDRQRLTRREGDERVVL